MEEDEEAKAGRCFISPLPHGEPFKTHLWAEIRQDGKTIICKTLCKTTDF